MGRWGEYHYQTGTPEHKAWLSMRDRCLCPTNKQFPDYGGRGIRICERWLTFTNFLQDMGKRPSPKHTLERIDNNGNYEPSNCAWRTMREQSRNRRDSRKITHNDTTANLVDWAATLGLSIQCLRYRVNNWPLEKAMTPTKRRYTHT
jgi:hypothetical protein